MYPGNTEDDRVGYHIRLLVCLCADLLTELYKRQATDPWKYRASLQGGDVYISNVLVDRGYVLVLCNAPDPE